MYLQVLFKSNSGYIMPWQVAGNGGADAIIHLMKDKDDTTPIRQSTDEAVIRALNQSDAGIANSEYSKNEQPKSSSYHEFQRLVEASHTILVLQADNPDGDSLGSSLALEAILSDLGKKVIMVCAVDMPSYLRYLSGWDRVLKEIPQNFDMSIIVDTSSDTLFEHFNKSKSFSWVKTKPLVVLDHHTSTDGLEYATLTINETTVATGELIYNIAKELKWNIALDAGEMLATSIMSDSLGLTSEATGSGTFLVMADLVSQGVNLAKIESNRRELMRKSPELIAYKGQLLQRIKTDSTGRIATITIPWAEIERYSPHYNPSVLVIDEMRMQTDVDVAIAYKTYPDGRITAKIRCNYGYGIAGELGMAFGGGGHPYAGGFKITDGSNIDEVYIKVEKKAHELLAELPDRS